MIGRAGIVDAVLEIRGRHLANRHHIADAGAADKLLQIFVNMRPVGKQPSPQPLGIIGKNLRLGDEVNDIKAESGDAALLPKPYHLGELVPYGRIRPIQIRLTHIVQMQIPFAQARLPLPGTAPERTLPIGRRLPRVVGALLIAAVTQNVVALVIRIAREGPLEPRVLIGGVAKHHVQHDFQSFGIGGLDQRVKVIHRAEMRIDGQIIGDIIAVVLLRRDEKGRQPKVVHPHIRQIIQRIDHAAQIPDTVAVGVLERLGVNLINDLILEVCHIVLLPIHQRQRARRIPPVLCAPCPRQNDAITVSPALPVMPV